MANGRFLAFGEILLRLSPPGRKLFLQSSQLDVWVGGAEANVATALARLGHSTAIASALPDNALGDAALAQLRAAGTDTTGVLRRGNRIGLYFVTPGAGLRATEVFYDRANSAFAETPADHWNWSELLAGADRIHLSGITPALGPTGRTSALAAAQTACELGVPVSFDGNYRALLWEAWDGQPQATLRTLVDHSDLFFGNCRDLSLILGETFSGTTRQERRQAAEAAFKAFPRCQLIASTIREVVSTDEHRVAARIDTVDRGFESEFKTISGITDRIGAGDAFAAGVLHEQRRGGAIEEMAETGLALTCLKHGLPGAASLFDQRELDAFKAGRLDVRR
ncbi:MAG TPA: sugar kinase [Sphingomicrobium sp.]|nr:sugar kinase [Sphingomicrobium sp.]